MAVGHVRYSTTGETILRNVQPLFAELATGGLAIGHNGNLTNGLTLRRELIAAGAIYQSTSDTEVILHLVARSQKRRIVERYIDALRSLEGAYSLVALTNKKLIGARDPLGIRPLILGELNGAYMLCSETCALDIIGARFVREIDNGEVVVISEAGTRIAASLPEAGAASLHLRVHLFLPARQRARRPLRLRSAQADGPAARPRGAGRRRRGHSGSRFRRSGGARLRPAVRTSPSSSASSAITMWAAPSSSRRRQIRALGVKLKHNANRAVIRGKRVLLVDDSIVRGTTSVKIVHMMYEAGAREVHMRIASPPITHPDFYGIDTPEQHQLLAATHTLEEMRDFIGVDLAGLPVGRRHLQVDGPAGTRSGPAAIHRPLLHRRLSDRAHRP